jgi:hypothetical protein
MRSKSSSIWTKSPGALMVLGLESSEALAVDCETCDMHHCSSGVSIQNLPISRFNDKTAIRRFWPLTATTDINIGWSNFRFGTEKSKLDREM